MGSQMQMHHPEAAGQVPPPVSRVTDDRGTDVPHLNCRDLPDQVCSTAAVHSGQLCWGVRFPCAAAGRLDLRFSRERQGLNLRLPERGTFPELNPAESINGNIRIRSRPGETG